MTSKILPTYVILISLSLGIITIVGFFVLNSTLKKYGVVIDERTLMTVGMPFSLGISLLYVVAEERLRDMIKQAEMEIK